MAIIKSTARFAATSEQQKLLQRNIHAQAACIRNEQELDTARAQRAKLAALEARSYLVNPNQMECFLKRTMEMVDRAIANSQVTDLESVLMVERVVEGLGKVGHPKQGHTGTSQDDTTL